MLRCGGASSGGQLPAGLHSCGPYQYRPHSEQYGSHRLGESGLGIGQGECLDCNRTDERVRGEVMKMKNQLIALLLALVLLLVLGLKNMDPVTLDFFVGSVEMPLVYLLAAFVLVGMIMVWAVALVGRFRSGLQRSRLREEIGEKDREIEGLKTELAKHESLAGDAAVREAQAFEDAERLAEAGGADSSGEE